MRTASPQRVIRFDAFTLDLSRCVLLRGAVEVPMRRQAFDMLRYLAERPGTLVTKQELVDAIWRKVIVSDDSLTRCVSDIREALGDRDHRVVQTVRGRGYLLAANGVAADAGAAPPQTTVAGTVLRYARLTGWRGVAALVAAVIAAAAGIWSWQVPPPAANAGHYAILGRNIIANERSAKSIRDALAHFAKALALDPDWVPALLGYASVMIIEVGGEWVPPEERPARLDQARGTVERALKVQPTSAYAHQLKGVLLRMRGDPDRAVAAFERSLQLNPASPWTHAEFARTKIDLGRAEEALADIQTAMRIHPSETAVHVWYCWAGMAALHAGRDDEAIRWLLKAREMRPIYPHPVPLLAVAYAATGREVEARALMAEHLARAPGLTMQTFQREYPPQNPTVARQRDRITSILQRLGVPGGKVQTGSVR
jgi:DNA-binding winged helix-turn-helix (wHTH) protein/cytochrome c-type biogenesis protein CcmH/NrfG